MKKGGVKKTTDILLEGLKNSLGINLTWIFSCCLVLEEGFLEIWDM